MRLILGLIAMIFSMFFAVLAAILGFITGVKKEGWYVEGSNRIVNYASDGDSFIEITKSYECGWMLSIIKPITKMDTLGQIATLPFGGNEIELECMQIKGNYEKVCYVPIDFNEAGSCLIAEVLTSDERAKYINLLGCQWKHSPKDLKKCVAKIGGLIIR